MPELIEDEIPANFYFRFKPRSQKQARKLAGPIFNALEGE
jgi:hypothetical protein